MTLFLVNFIIPIAMNLPKLGLVEFLLFFLS